MSRSMKDAIVICLDVGLGMQNHHPNDSSPLQNAIDFTSMLIQRKIFAESKDKLALVLFGSDDTANELSEDGSYSNINVAFQMGVPDFNLLTFVSHNLVSGTVSSDFLDALTVCLDIIYRETSSDKKIRSRRIILVSNLDHNVNDDEIEGIMNGFKAENMNVELHVVGTDFNADDFSRNTHDDKNIPSTSRATHNRNNFNSKPKSLQQQKSEGILRNVFENDIEGTCYSFAEGIKAVSGFEKRSVNSVAWKCNLTLGNELSICCVAYAKCKEAKLKKNWKKCHAKTMKESDISRDVYLFIDDEDETEVTKEEIGKGFKYGKDVIPFGKVDTEEMKYQTEGKKLTILGFTDQRNVSAELFMDDQAHFLLPEKDDSAASTALSSMVMALNNQGFCAIACYVYRKGSGPKIVALIPRVKSDYQCFVMVALPFSEDIRPFSFPSLEISDNKDREEQLDCVGNFIDALSLEQPEEEEDLFEPRNMLNPYFQRTFQCLHHYIQHGRGTDLPPVSNNVQEILSPPSELLHNAEPLIKEMTKLFKLEVIIEKKMKKAWKHKSSQELSTDNGDSKHVKLDHDDTTLASITSTNRISIGTISPVQDFERILNSGFNIAEGFRLFQDRIKEFVSDSFSSSFTDKIIECLKALIQQAEKHSMSYSVNNFLIELKLQSEDNNQSLWNAMVENHINLINASLEERKTFCSSKEEKEVEEEEKMEEEGAAEDLLDMMD